MKPAPYGPYPFIPINSPKRPKITWPNNKALAFWCVLNIEFFPLDEPVPGLLNERIPRNQAKIPSIAHWAYRDYGNQSRRVARDGSFQAQQDAQLSDAQCLDVRSPSGDRSCGQGSRMGVSCARLDEFHSAERNAAGTGTRHHQRIFDRIEKEIGKRPHGWLSSGMEETWNTLDYLVEQGCQYIADWNTDDQPYLMNFDGKRLVSLPYSWELNDNPQNSVLRPFVGGIRRDDPAHLRGSSS